MILKQGLFPDKQKIQKHLSLHHEWINRMMDNLQYMKFQPEVILDWGCHDAYSSQALKKHFPKARLMALDSRFEWCQVAKKKSTWRKPLLVLNASFENIPLASESVDMIFAQQLYCPMPQLQIWLKECFRVLKPQGCLMFSALGPDTFKEYAAFRSCAFMDLHDIGDELLREGFLDPVMSRQDLLVRYQENNAVQETLALWQIYPSTIEVQQLTYELIFAQAWRASQKLQSPQQQTIPLAAIRKKLAKD